jgi:hypothetical protein
MARGVLGELAFAVRCYETYVALAERSGDGVGLITGLRTLGYTLAREPRGGVDAALLFPGVAVATGERCAI